MFAGLNNQSPLLTMARVWAGVIRVWRGWGWAITKNSCTAKTAGIK